jgi:dihydroorotate dehydrogenase electron transfer subunit
MQDIPKSIPIKKIIIENPYVKTFVFDSQDYREGEGLNAKPGQFVNLWLPGIGEKPMSVAYCDEKEFWITIFAVGDFSRAMHDRKEGDLVGVRGPYGKGFWFKEGERIIMMAGGYGAAPLYFATSEAVKAGCEIDFVIGARSKDYLLYLDRVRALEHGVDGKGSVALYIATDDGSEGEKGYNVLFLDKLIAEAKAGKAMKEICDGNICKQEEVTVKPIDWVYSCGPELMMKSVSDKCFDAGVSAQLSVERYMKCGFGVCGQCCVDDTGVRSCKEGPVFDNDRARKITEFGKYHRDGVGRIHEF